MLILGLTAKGLAQDGQDATATMEIADSLHNATLELGRVKFTPFLAPSYSPEMQVLLSGGGLLSFKADPEDPLLLRSSIPMAIGYSSNGSFMFNARPFIYFAKDRFRLSGEFEYRDMPDNYWGVGFDNGKNVPLSDSTTGYQRNYFRLFGKLVHQYK